MKRSTFVKETIGSLTKLVDDQTFHLRGQKLTSGNARIWNRALHAWLYLSLDLGYQDRLRDYKVPGDVGFFLNTLTSAWDYLLLRPTVSNFKGWLRKESRFNVLYPIYDDSLRFLRTNDADTLGRIFSWCTFLKKVPLDMPELEEEMWQDWLLNEARLETVSTSSNLLDSLNAILVDWLRDFQVDIRPRHGLGSVAEGSLSKQEKYLSIGFDKMLEITCCPGNHDQITDFFPAGTNANWERISRLIFVPKTYKKLRTVCPEPATLQYFQQPVMKSLYAFITKHEYLHNRIPITNQTVNRKGAQLGSATGQYCTIDLSAASDSVKWSNAKRIFHGTPLYPWLISTRSSRVYYPEADITVAVSKFAPMGSALCFPVECLIFAAVCEYVGRSGLYSEQNIAHYSVYGDDIVCPTSWYPAIELVLSELGFLVNKEKSFFTGTFRESCGAEYYNGVLLPHLGYKVPFSRFNTAVCYDPLIDLANRAREWGFGFLRSFCIDELLEQGYKPLFSSNVKDTAVIHSDEDTNYHLRHRWNKNLFRREFFSHTIEDRPILASDVEQICLYEWLRDRPETENLSTPFRVDCDLRKVRLMQRWKHPWS